MITQLKSDAYIPEWCFSVVFAFFFLFQNTFLSALKKSSNCKGIKEMKDLEVSSYLMTISME